MNAFLTGSHAYGIPRPDSDIDIVMLVDDELYKLLNATYTGPIKDGKVNLIPFTNKIRYECWLKATEYLKTIAPVSREMAVARIRFELELAGIPELDGESGGAEQELTEIEIQDMRAI